MSSAPFALFLHVIRARVFGREYSAAPTRFHAHLYQLLRKLDGEGPKYFDFKLDVVLNELTDLPAIWRAKAAESGDLLSVRLSDCAF
jgi:hypothetical protein